LSAKSQIREDDIISIAAIREKVHDGVLEFDDLEAVSCCVNILGVEAGWNALSTSHLSVRREVDALRVGGGYHMRMDGMRERLGFESPRQGFGREGVWMAETTKRQLPSGPHTNLSITQ